MSDDLDELYYSLLSMLDERCVDRVLDGQRRPVVDRWRRLEVRRLDRMHPGFAEYDRSGILF